MSLAFDPFEDTMPTVPNATPAPTPTATPPPPNVTYTPAGYTTGPMSDGGTVQLFRGSDGKLYRNTNGKYENYGGDNVPLFSTQAEAWNFATGGTHTAQNPYTGGTPGGGGAGGPTYGDPGGFDGGAVDPQYLAPFTQTFAPRTPSYSQPNYLQAPAFEGFDPFSGPTAQDLYADPSYTLRRDEGANSIMNNRAARGIWNTGGSLKNFLKYNSDFASTEYKNLWDRDYNLWGANNQNKLSKYNTNLNSQFNIPNEWNYRASQDTRAQDNVDFGHDFDVFQDTRNQFYSNEDRPFDKLMRVANLGLN